MKNAPSEVSDYFCSSLGGAVKKAPPGGSAFAHRDALFYAEPGAGWNGDAITPKAQAWVAEFSQALRPYVNGAYVNVPNPAMVDWETAYWGDHYARLREIKAKYDPAQCLPVRAEHPPGVNMLTTLIYVLILWGIIALAWLVAWWLKRRGAAMAGQFTNIVLFVGFLFGFLLTTLQVFATNHYSDARSQAESEPTSLVTMYDDLRRISAAGARNGAPRDHLLHVVGRRA